MAAAASLNVSDFQQSVVNSCAFSRHLEELNFKRAHAKARTKHNKTRTSRLIGRGNETLVLSASVPFFRMMQIWRARARVASSLEKRSRPNENWSRHLFSLFSTHSYPKYEAIAAASKVNE